MDYRTAALAGQNIASIADAFVQMNDPAARTKAQLLKLSAEGARLRNEGLGIDNRFAPERNQSGIDLTRARITTEGSKQGYLNAGAGERNSASDINKLRVRAGEMALDGTPVPQANSSAAGAFTVPFTTYSRGGAAGPDEMTDQWTEKGFSSTGQNLMEGIAAVNPSRHPIGTIFRKGDGTILIAADKHGNKNPNVIDEYRNPENYRAESGQSQMEVIGREKIPYGTTPEQLQAIRDKYSRAANIFAQSGADDLAQAQARNAMLAAGDNEQAGRNAAAAISGQLPSQGEYATPGAASAFQERGLAAGIQQAQTVEAQQQAGLLQRKALDIAYGGTGSRGSSAGSAGGADVSGVSMVKPLHDMLASRFGMMTDDEQLVVSPEMGQPAGAWQTTYANLVDSGVSPVKAEVIADQHHQISNVQEEDPWFGAPRKEAGEGFNMQSMTPDQARAYAPAPAAGTPELPDIMTLLFGAQQPQGPAPMTGGERASPVSAVPQTGADSSKRGKALGTEKAKAKQQAGADHGTDWNTGTLNALKAAAARGVPIEDLIATIFAGGTENDEALTKAVRPPGSNIAMLLGEKKPDAYRNALRDARALQAAGIDPSLVAPFLNQQTGEIQSLVDQYRSR